MSELKPSPRPPPPQPILSQVFVIGRYRYFRYGSSVGYCTADLAWSRTVPVPIATVPSLNKQQFPFKTMAKRNFKNVGTARSNNNYCLVHTKKVLQNLCSGFGSVCFWTSRIWIRNYLYGSGSVFICTIRILQSTRNNLRKTMISTFFGFSMTGYL
jgi:hypothetical protein